MSLMRIDMGPEEALDQMNAFFESIHQIPIGYKLKVVEGRLAVESEQETVVLAPKAYGNVIVNVGPDEPYTTINDALDYFSEFYPQKGVKAIINLKPGFEMAEQVIVEGIDLGWITIISEDEEVVIKREALIESVTEPGSYAAVPNRKDRPAFCAKNFGVLPIIGTLFVMDESGSPYDREERQLYEGVMAYINSRARVLPGCGFKNVSGRACFAWRNSRIDCERAIFTNAKDRAIDAARGSTIVAEGAICDYGGEYGIRAFAGSWVHCPRASIKHCEGDGISAQNAIVNAESCDISFASNRGIYCSHASNVSAKKAIINDCGNDGVSVYNSTLLVEEAEITNAGRCGIYAFQASKISATRADVGWAVDHGIWANRGSYVDANQANASGVGNNGFHVSRGSIIAANEATGTTSQVPLQITSDGIIFK